MGHIIQSVPEGCLVAELGLVPGDELIAINGEKVIDLFTSVQNFLSFVHIINGTFLSNS